MRKISVAASLALTLIASMAAARSLEQVPERITGFLIGEPGHLASIPAAGPDATMSVDGVTTLELVWVDCFGLYGSGSLHLDMLGAPIAEDGGVAADPDDPRLGLASIPAEIVDGCWVAEGYYRVPDEFNRGGDDFLDTRFVTVELRFIPQAGGPAVISIFIDLVRPPVVFVHGLWSSRETWTFSLAENSLFPIRERADYAGTAAREFSVNRRIVYDAIQKSLERCRAQGTRSLQTGLAI